MNNKKNERIIKRREFILKFLYYFSFFSVLLAFIIGAYLEKKGKRPNIDIFMPSIIVYTFLIIGLMYFLSEKWGATKGGFYIPHSGTFGFSTNIRSKIGKNKKIEKNIVNYNNLLELFNNSTYSKKKVKIGNYESVLYFKNVFACFNGYILVEANDDILNSINEIKEKSINTLLDLSNNLRIISYNLMIIIYLKTDNSVNNLISKIDILDLDGYDELIITSIVHDNKLEYLNYISGPMKSNYDLNIKELKKIIK